MGVKEESSTHSTDGNAHGGEGKPFKTEDHEDKSQGADLYYNNNNRKSSNYGVNYKGDNDDIAVILALRTESFNNKVMFSTFIEKLKNHVLTSFSDGRDMMPI